MERHWLAMWQVTRDRRARVVGNATHEVAGVADGVVVAESDAGVLLSDTPCVCVHRILAVWHKGNHPRRDPDSMALTALGRGNVSQSDGERGRVLSCDHAQRRERGDSGDGTHRGGWV